jgi:hypothetical protein
VRDTLTELGKGTGKWPLRVFGGWDAYGKIVTIFCNFTGSRRRAERALAKLDADVERNQAESHNRPLGELLDAWLEDIDPHRSRYTTREHRRSVYQRIKPALGSVRLDQLNG